jgi:hypothetical protein
LVADHVRRWEKRTMTLHTRAEIERLGRLARREFPQALMSDSKWRKLFAAVDQAGLAPERVLVKFIDVDDIKSMRFPAASALHPPRPYIDTFEFGPIELRSIEWLLIPRQADIRGVDGVPARMVEQDVDTIYELVASLGKFPLEQIEDGLKVIGHRR